LFIVEQIYLKKKNTVQNLVAMATSWNLCTPGIETSKILHTATVKCISFVCQTTYGLSYLKKEKKDMNIFVSNSKQELYNSNNI